VKTAQWVLPLGTLLTVAVMAACAGPASKATPSSSEDRAVAAARTVAQGSSSSPVTLVSTASGRFGSFEPGAGITVAEPSREVWAVTFRGTFIGTCGPAQIAPATAPRGPCSVGSTRVIVDASTGTFIMAEEPAPGL
jgi:hypothetical protein